MVKLIKKIKNGNNREIYFLGIHVWTYRKKGLQFKCAGENVVVMKHHRIYFSENISMGNNVRIGTRVYIDALGGLPGVRTARWAGEEACDVKNRQKALFELKGIHNRHARFRTVISLIIADRLQQVEGVVDGIIALQEEGDGGFGYDPIFIPEGYDTTFANLPSEVKNSISHRARAICALKEVLQK